MLARSGVLSLRARQASQLFSIGLLASRVTSPVVSCIRPYSQHTHASGPASFTSRNRKILVATSVAALALGLGLSKRKSLEDASKSQSKEGGVDCNPLARVPLRTLLRGYFVYTCCSIPILVDCGPAVVDWCKETSIPGVWSCFEFVVRNTFFPQVS